jgi:hypothetical protein
MSAPYRGNSDILDFEASAIYSKVWTWKTRSAV